VSSEEERESPPPFRRDVRTDLARAAGCLPAIVLLVLGALGLGRPVSVAFYTALLFLLGLAAGAWSPARLRRRVLLMVLGLAATGAAATLILSGDSEHPFLEELRIPSGEPLPRWTSLLPERDAAIVSAPFLASARESEGLVPALDAVYDELDDDVSLRRSTQLRTLFGAQSRDGSDAHLHREPNSENWLVFLHGFGGNAVSACWIVSRAAARAGWNTICPSTSFGARWWSDDGQAILRETFRFARRRGARRFVIAGYSNGASGALQWLRDHDDPSLHGLVLVSGFQPNVDPAAIRVPTLIVSGAEDEVFDAARLRSWARRIARSEVMIERGGDHMMIVKARSVVESAITGFLRRL
jgi:hypothetical protein